MAFLSLSLPIFQELCIVMEKGLYAGRSRARQPNLMLPGDDATIDFSGAAEPLQETRSRFTNT